MAAIIHPSTHPMPDAAVRRRPAPPALRLLPGAHPSRPLLFRLIGRGRLPQCCADVAWWWPWSPAS